MSGKKLPTKNKATTQNKKFTYLKDRGSILGIKIGVFHHHLENNIPVQSLENPLYGRVLGDFSWPF